MTVPTPAAIFKRVFIALLQKYARVGFPFHPIEQRVRSFLWDIVQNGPNFFKYCRILDGAVVGYDRDA